MAASRCLERYLVSSSVLRLSCVLQAILDRSHWNCYIVDVIWMLRFARDMVFFRVSGASVAEKSRLARGTVLGVAALPWNLARNARAMWGCQVTFSRPCWCCAIVFLCFACVDTLCALELVHQSNVLYCSVLQCYGILHVLKHFVHWNWHITAMCFTVYTVLQFSCLFHVRVCRSQWNGCVKILKRITYIPRQTHTETCGPHLPCESL